jgi:hypothetical protein
MLLDEVVEKPNDSSLSRTMVNLWPNLSLVHLIVRNGDSIKA